MNTPGTATGNWTWRFDWSTVGSAPARHLGRLTAASGRAPIQLLRAP
jgi:4-alpha-glucanotransferase